MRVHLAGICWISQSSTKYIALTRLAWVLILISDSVKDASSDPNCCLTWNLLNNSLRLVCQLRNDKMSASLFDPYDNHRAKCNVQTRGLNCVSTKITESVEYEADLKQVVLTIPLNKDQLNLDGKWICQQHNLSYTTAVNITGGITFSTSLNIIGEIHQSNSQLKTGVTCQACRQPYGNTAEFQINGRTVAHIRYDWRTKTCFLRREACNGTSCSCSHNGKKFFVEMETYNGSRYTCLMLFVDKTNRVRFQQTATLLFDGKEFHRSDTETKIIKGANSKILSTTTVLGLVPIVPKQEEVINIFTDYLGVWIICAVLILIVILAWPFAKIRLHINGKKKEDEFELTDESKYSEESKPMLQDEQVFRENVASASELVDKPHSSTEYCKCCSLQQLIEKAVEICLDCRQYFCSKCLNTFHSITEEMKRHITVNLDMVPEQFSPSIFNCSLSDHKNDLLEYWCNTHKEPVCNKCMSSKHSSCHIQMLSDISTDCVAIYQPKFKVIEKQVQSYKQFIRNSVDSYKNKHVFIRKEIELAEQSCYQVKTNKRSNTKLSKRQAMQKLDEIEIDREKEATKLYGRYDDLLTKQKIIFEFVVKFGGKNHVVISDTSILGKLKESLSVLSFSNLDITFEHKSGIIEISEVPLKVSHVSNESNYQGKKKDFEITEIASEKSISTTTVTCRKRKKSDNIISYQQSENETGFLGYHYM